MSTKFDDPAELMVTRNVSASRFEITIAGHLARVDYRMSGNRMIITHTEVPEGLRGKRVGEQLVACAVKYARKDGLEIVGNATTQTDFSIAMRSHRRPEEYPQNQMATIDKTA